VAQSEPVKVYVEDLFWLRSQLREKVRSGRLEEHLVPKANRLYAFVADLCDEYQDSEHDHIFVRLNVVEKR